MAMIYNGRRNYGGYQNNYRGSGVRVGSKYVTSNTPRPGFYPSKIRPGTYYKRRTY